MNFALAPETLTGLAPVPFLRAAATAGFQHVGLRVIEGRGNVSADDAPALASTPATLAEIRAILDGEGLTVTELEWASLDGTAEIAAYRPGLDIGASLGARHLCAVITDREPTRALDSFAALCALAAEHDIAVDIEFVPFTSIRTIAEAADLVRRSGAANAGILFDALHHMRGGGTRAGLAAYRHLVRQAQLCDAPAEAPESKGDRIRETLHSRLLPGEGGADLTAALELLTPETPFSLEIPHRQRLAEQGSEAYARHALAAAKACFGV